MNSKQYPLQYPIGRQRTQYPERSKFKPGSIYSEAQSLYVAHRSGHSLSADYLQASGEDGHVFQPNAHTAGVQ